VRATRIIGGLSLLVLFGVIAWDLADDGFWSHHALFASLLASLIVVAVTAAVLNEVLERRQRERWSVLAQYALFDLVRTARLVWGGLLELAGLVPDDDLLGDGALAAGSEAVRDTPRLAAAMDEMLARADRREQLHRLIVELLAQGQEVLGRWADVMVNSGMYAEIVDRHVELYSRLYWWGSVLDESEPLAEHQNRPRLSRVSPATQAGPIEDEWLRDNLVAIAQLAESLDRTSFELAFQIVTFDWWVSQLPDRPSTAESVPT
jgi:hypothetical protein